MKMAFWVSIGKFPNIAVAILHFSLLLSISYIYHPPNCYNSNSWLSFSLLREAITIILPLLSPSRASNIAVAIIGKSMTMYMGSKVQKL